MKEDELDSEKIKETLKKFVGAVGSSVARRGPLMELTRIQPMTIPQGNIFYREYVYFTPRCENPDHPGHGKALAACDRPECVVRRVLET